MKFLYKLEKKFGKYSIKNLPIILALLFAFNYLLSVAAPDVYEKLILLPYDVYKNHQFWRLFTWIFTAPGEFDEWTVVSLVVLYFIGRSAEHGMGTFMFNLYMITSMLSNFITVMVVGSYYYFTGNSGEGYSLNAAAELISGGVVINFLVPTSVLFAFAMAYMESTILFMFLFPIKAKYVAAIDFAVWIYYYFKYPIVTLRALIIVNFALFFVFYNILKKYSSRNSYSFSFNEYANSKKKKKSSGFKVRDNKDNVYNMSDYVGRKHGGSEKQVTEEATRHKCAVCGRTENDGEDLVFRYCTKCNGNYEYCNEHIYTHEHVK